MSAPTETTDTTQPAPGGRAKLTRPQQLQQLARDRRTILVGLIILVALALAVVAPEAVTPSTLLRLSQYGVVVGILAVGQTIVILTGRGNIDLSVGSNLSVCGVVIALLATNGVNIWLAGVIGLLVGAALGAFNGALVTIVGVPALIGTIGTLFLFGSTALVLSGGTSISGFATDGYALLGHARILGAPIQLVAIMLPLYALAIFAMNRTRSGRAVYEVGNNDVAAALVGTSPRRVRLGAFIFSGALAGLGANITNAWLMTARPEVGSGMELLSLVIAVLGGVHIMGGRGRMSGTLLAVALVTLINSGMQLAGIDQIWQRGVLGGLLVGAVLINNLFEHRGAR